MDLVSLLKEGIEAGASDIHITVGLPPVMRINGEMVATANPILAPEDTKSLAYSALDENFVNELEDKGETDTSFEEPGIGRFRVNAFKQKGSYGMVMRIIPVEIPSIESLGLPEVIPEFTKLIRGLVLVTGPTGSGKSTTLASMIAKMNKETSRNIITLEDPIEYVHQHNKSVVSQREIGKDSMSFANGLRAALRQDPDVILVGEMRDLETISVALTAAETGHLVLSTLHTLGAAKTIDRILDTFPPHQQRQARLQLASTIEGVISQQLMPRKDGQGRAAAFEVMVATPGIRNLIREEKIHQIEGVIQTGKRYKMETMDNALVNLYRRGIISKDEAMDRAINRENITKHIM